MEDFKESPHASSAYVAGRKLQLYQVCVHVAGKSTGQQDGALVSQLGAFQVEFAQADTALHDPVTTLTNLHILQMRNTGKYPFGCTIISWCVQ